MQRYYEFKRGVPKYGWAGISSIDLAHLQSVHVSERGYVFRNREYLIDVMFLHSGLTQESDISFIFGGNGGVILGPERTVMKTTRSIRHYASMESVEQELSDMKSQYEYTDWSVHIEPKLLEE